MTLLAAERLSKKFNEQVILHNASFSINSGERIALVGKNGTGKTTLLEIIAGKQAPDSGQLVRTRGCQIEYVEQEKTEYLHYTLYDFVADARRELVLIHSRLREIEHHLALFPTDTAALAELGRLQHDFEKGGGFDFETELKIILTGLGFDEDRFGDRLQNFSGGEKNRAGLARVLAGQGTLLLLDEPTNHLDIESTAWLEEYLTKIDKACLIVSHDRAFMNAASMEVWELAFGEIDLYVGGFEKYLLARAERKVHAEHAYKLQQEEIKRAEEFIRRNMAGQKTKQAQSRLKHLNKLKRLPPPKTDYSGPAISMELSGRSFLQVLEIREIELGYGTETILQNVSFDIYRGEKIGLIGRNGSGKSTLLKALIGEITPRRGAIRLGSNVEVAYFDQELSDIDLEQSVLDNMWQVDPMVDVHTIRSYLGRYAFTGDDVFKLAMSLSGGEKTKLSLARLLYKPSNFVILDEPTNHLDIFAREALEGALKEYDGACLIVSHDRYFLNRVAERIIHVKDGGATVYNGNYDYFKEKSATSSPRPTRWPQVTTRARNLRERESSYKDESRRKSRQRREVQSIKSKIADAERELERLDVDIGQNIPVHKWEELHSASTRRKQVEESLIELYLKLEEFERTGESA